MHNFRVVKVEPTIIDMKRTQICFQNLNQPINYFCKTQLISPGRRIIFARKHFCLRFSQGANHSMTVINQFVISAVITAVTQCDHGGGHASSFRSQALQALTDATNQTRELVKWVGPKESLKFPFFLNILLKASSVI